MKQLSILTFFIALYCLTGCKKDDHANDNKLSGTWVGNVCGNTVDLNTDTLKFRSESISHINKDWQYYLPKYTLRNDTVFYTNGSTQARAAVFFESRYKMRYTEFMGSYPGISYCLTRTD